MKTTTGFVKFKGEISITVKTGTALTLTLSEEEAQELLLQLGDILMVTQGHVQTGRPVAGSIPKTLNFIADRK